MRNLISNLIANTLNTAEHNNAVASKKSFERFTACSGTFNPKAVKGGNGEEEDGANGIIIEDIIVD